MTALTPAHSLPPYPAYQSSGVAWLGDVPAHWEVRRLKTICRLAYGDSLSAAHRMPGDIPVYGSNGLVGYHTIPNTDGQCIIIGRKGSFGKVHYSDQSAFAIDTAFFIDQRYTSANIRWLYYLLGWLKLDAFSKDSAIPGLNRNDAYQHIGLLPPPEEQAAIVRYLDDAVVRIHRARQVKTRLAELLHEYRQAAIHHAVTRGLNPDAPLKSSSIPWLGDVPAHWEVRRLKTMASIVNGATPSTLTPEYWGGDITWLTPEDLGRLDTPYIENGARSIPQKGYDSCGTNIAPAGSLVISTRAPIGHIAILCRPACVNQGCRLIIPTDTIQSRYLYYQLAVAKSEIASFGKGTTFMELSKADLASFRVACPPQAEQAAIVAHLDQLTAKLDAAIAGARQSAVLLDEYGAALIAAAVTGQVDVRAVAGPLTVAG